MFQSGTLVAAKELLAEDANSKALAARIL